ncbi:hypothetical protein [Teichococcus rhizosphaerae]|nr:hypothetical protein [Pseudoroseomonas rhizosphaerae]
MSDVVADPAFSLAAETREDRPSPARGLLWGGVLSIPLWALIGLVVARAF